MTTAVALSDHDLATYTKSADLSKRAHALLQHQKESWDALREGYRLLDHVETRSLDFGDYAFRLQFNPRRITSSAAKVDAKSIAKRPCFLCPANLPKEQRGLRFNDKYLVLCNPFPIFPEHFTIPDLNHVPQRILATFGDMLDLTQALGQRYVVFYNGPKCGASAPDHFHFQAGNRGFMPIDSEYDYVKTHLGRQIANRGSLHAYAVDKYLRSLISFESPSRTALMDAFHAFYSTFDQMLTHKAGVEHDEPMLNVITSYERGYWRVILFPRAKHRPSCFFAEGEERMMLSPASVDFGGVVVTPVEKDFRRVDKGILSQMFKEVCLPTEKFEDLTQRLTAAL
jgi:ATP adenylyltransferase/5',5'''-P-1,P-4-tetraphosphate phosphorylase II